MISWSGECEEQLQIPEWIPSDAGRSLVTCPSIWTRTCGVAQVLRRAQGSFGAAAGPAYYFIAGVIHVWARRLFESMEHTLRPARATKLLVSPRKAAATGCSPTLVRSARRSPERPGTNSSPSRIPVASIHGARP